MQSQQIKVILIKDDQEENQCNNKIIYLRSQRLCERKARLCSQRCQACQEHGDERLKNQHTVVQIQRFNKAFQLLQESCRRETEHYIRQINDAEKKAVEEIRRKKDEYIKQIQEVKSHMMKKTYRTLEEKYTNLYDKYKNQRLEGLKCCEVFWVMNALPSSHSIKHSEINKKLEAILRKFQSFKQVSRNLSNQNIFNPKQKIKKTKISQKIGPAQVRKDPTQLKPVNYDGQLMEKYKRAISKCAQQLKQLKNQKIQKQKQLNQLQLQLRNRLRKIDYLKPKLTFSPQIINIKYPDSEIPFSFNPIHVNHQTTTEQKASGQQNAKESRLMYLLHQFNKPINASNNSLQQNKQQNPIIDKQSNQEIISQNIHQEGQLEQVQSLPINQSAQNNPLVQQSQNEVKLEPMEQEPFIQWQNTELVQQIRKYGNSISQGLKVQEIDKLRTFNYVRPPQQIVRINSSLMKKPQSLSKNDKLGTPQKKVTNFSILASSLFQRHEMKRQMQADKQEKADKSQKKSEPSKQS